ncbi:MAG: hypothetical protein L6R35_001788 [Caloplaca aegaea]|nr:MAG: hypothetical protein L6R35_001788 [Caloplaca aegaea]
MASASMEYELSWAESSPGLWSRGLDATEVHFRSMGATAQPYNREFGLLSIVMKIDFGGIDPVPASRDAWKALRFHNPLIASSVDGSKRYYRVASEQELESWLEETFIVHTASESYHNVEQLRLDLGPVRRAQLHLLPQNHELLLHIGHDVMDGQAMLLLVNNLLQELCSPTAEIKFGSEAANLPPPLILAANIPTVTESTEVLVKKAINDWFAALPWLSLKAVNTERPPGNTRAQRQKLTETETEAVIAAAKVKGFTPTHVVEAAAILAIAELDPDSADKSYGSCGIFSLRQQCNLQWRHAVSPYLHIYPLVIKPTDFADSAAQLKDYYQGQRSDMRSLLSLVQPTYQAFANMASTTPAPGSNQMISLSSLGKFEPLLQSVHGVFKLEDLWLMYETPNAVVTSFLWTREGRLSWQVMYNDNYYEEDTITTWITTTKRILFEGLGIHGLEGDAVQAAGREKVLDSSLEKRDVQSAVHTSYKL